MTEDETSILIYLVATAADLTRRLDALTQALTTLVPGPVPDLGPGTLTVVITTDADAEARRYLLRGWLGEAIGVYETVLGSRELAVSAVNVLADRIGVPGIRRPGPPR